MQEREHIPRPLRRQVEVEAGHRCAIPTCRDTVGLQIHHIEPWVTVQSHSFENLILLCSRCHQLEQDNKIDRLSMTMYKRNLGLLVGRYGEMERRLLDKFIAGDDVENWKLGDGRVIENAIRLESVRDFDFYYLIRDGLLIRHDTRGPSVGGIPFGPVLYGLTDHGKTFVEHLANGRAAEDVSSGQT